MNADEDYGFDIAGFLHLHQVLTSAQVESCRQAISSAGGEDATEWPLQSHPRE